MLRFALECGFNFFLTALENTLNTMQVGYIRLINFVNKSSIFNIGLCEFAILLFMADVFWLIGQ